MKHSVKRWVYIINVLRALPHVDMDGESLEIEYRKLDVSFNDDAECTIIDHLTGEVHVVFDECGAPIILSPWADEPMQWDQYDYPMYE